jgi:hypothetical protein
MTSLKLQLGTTVEVKKGLVDINGPCVALYELDKNGDTKLVKAYHLQPGEIVRRTEGDNYVVE